MVAKFVVLIGVLASAAPLAAPLQVFRARSDLVVLQVFVQDGRGRPVADLTEQAFEVREDGVLQHIQLFMTQDRPVAVGLVVDNSTSMVNKRADVASAADAFARASNRRDALFLVNFDEQPSFALPPSERFTSDLEVFRSALMSIGAHGRTSLYDGIAVALDRVNESDLDRRALVVISDGNDNRSARSFQDVRAAALRSNVVIYAVGIYDPVEGADRKVLTTLADATGGLAMFPVSPSDIGLALERISTDIRHGYTLGYVSTNAKGDGRFRKTAVKVSDPATHRSLRARVRSGYV